MTALQNNRLGIILMIITMVIFGAQDGISKHLASEYNVYMVVMIRYWFFAAFVLTISIRMAGSLRKAAHTSQPVLQISRGVLLAAEIIVMVTGFTMLGLVESLAIFICYPLIVTALSGPILKEHVGWMRWIAVCIGFVGIVILLQPSAGVFQTAALVPLLSALMFSVYTLMTRYAARRDTATVSFFWTGVMGCVFMTMVGIWHWQPMTAGDWGWMALLCMLGALGHYLLIKCYELAEASAVQPFVYIQLVSGAFFGVMIFGEVITQNIAIGSAIVIGAGIFTFWRERVKAR